MRVLALLLFASAASLAQTIPPPISTFPANSLYVQYTNLEICQRILGMLGMPNQPCLPNITAMANGLPVSSAVRFQFSYMDDTNKLHIMTRTVDTDNNGYAASTILTITNFSQPHVIATLLIASDSTSQ